MDSKTHPKAMILRNYNGQLYRWVGPGRYEHVRNPTSGNFRIACRAPSNTVPFWTGDNFLFTHPCVLETECSMCGAEPGESCRPGTKATTHWKRRDDYNKAKRMSKKNADDIQASSVKGKGVQSPTSLKTTFSSQSSAETLKLIVTLSKEEWDKLQRLAEYNSQQFKIKVTPEECFRRMLRSAQIGGSGEKYGAQAPKPVEH